MNCLGYETNCIEKSNIGFDFCENCFKTKSDKIAKGYCGISGCYKNKYKNHNWCQSCFYIKSQLPYFENKLDKIQKKYDHDCSSRGGVACSYCDAYYDVAKPLILKVNNIKKIIKQSSL